MEHLVEILKSLKKKEENGVEVEYDLELEYLRAKFRQEYELDISKEIISQLLEDVLSTSKLN